MWVQCMQDLMPGCGTRHPPEAFGMRSAERRKVNVLEMKCRGVGVRVRIG